MGGSGGSQEPDMQPMSQCARARSARRSESYVMNTSEYSEQSVSTGAQ